jgi:hypothetical protein
VAGSGAGLNYANKILLTCAPGGGPYDSGIQLTEAAYFSKTSFQLIAAHGTTTISGWSVACYGTHDARAIEIVQGIGPWAAFVLPASSWVEVALPQSETTPTWANPLTAFGQTAFSPEPWVAVRVVATATAATGSIAVVCTRIP